MKKIIVLTLILAMVAMPILATTASAQPWKGNNGPTFRGEDPNDPGDNGGDSIVDGLIVGGTGGIAMVVFTSPLVPIAGVPMVIYGIGDFIGLW